MEHQKITTPRGIVHYWIHKNTNPNADCIVFTHGVTANHTMFERQVEFFLRDFTIITWDVPMHGQSRPYADFSYNNAANDLLTILRSESICDVVLVGMSMGGYPSQELAVICPDIVKGFVALDTTPFGLSYYSKSDEWWLKRVEPMAKLFPDKMLRHSMAKSVSVTDYAYAMMRKMLAPLTKAEIAKQMGLAYSGFLKENKDVHFNFPVLILVGEHDKTGKVKQYCETWAKNTGYPLHIVKDAAHFANADQPDVVNDEILKFITHLPAKTKK